MIKINEIFPLRIGSTIWIKSLRKMYKKNNKKKVTDKMKWKIEKFSFLNTIDSNLAKETVNRIVVKKINKIDLRTTKSNSCTFVFRNDKKGMETIATWNNNLWWKNELFIFAMEFTTIIRW